MSNISTDQPTDAEIEAEAKSPWQDVRAVGHSEAKEIASRLIAGSFHRSDKRPNFSIPCRPDHDDDCLIMGYIAQQEAANVAHARHVLEQRRPEDVEAVRALVADTRMKWSRTPKDGFDEMIAQAVIDAYGKLPSPPQITNADVLRCAEAYRANSYPSHRAGVRACLEAFLSPPPAPVDPRVAIVVAQIGGNYGTATDAERAAKRILAALDGTKADA